MARRTENNIVISPSGNLYGSEYVLYDFLKGSDNTYAIYVPKNSVFHAKLKEEDFNVYGFTSVKMLYVLVFFKLLFNSVNLYLNEAGHISYVKILSRLFPSRNFIVSVRLLEDCNNKLKKLSKNTTLIPVSEYLRANIISNAETNVIYDPYSLTNSKEPSIDNKGKFIIGLIGRVSFTKGLDDLVLIVNRLSKTEIESIQFRFYGTFDAYDLWFKNFKETLGKVNDLDYQFCGYKTQDEIYSNCNLILHLNKVEALGRIIFEAIDNNVPFLCYGEGGTGELAVFLELPALTCENIDEFIVKIRLFIEPKSFDNYDYDNAKRIINSQFNPKQYAEQIEFYLL
jgi:glycosyltransferase involved in cell wall biosynthesis